MTASIFYDVYTDSSYLTYYRPVDCYVRLASVKNGKTCTYLRGIYETTGQLYNASTFNLKQTNYSHLMTAYSSYPTIGYMHWGNKPLSESTGVLLLVGSIDVGMYYTIDFGLSDGTVQSFTGIKIQ